MIGDVPDLGWLNILMNGEKCASGWISFELPEAVVVGTFRIPFENVASAWLFVVSHFTSAHDLSRFLPPRGMPMIVPLMYAEP
jgi:hypothetical protein